MTPTRTRTRPMPKHSRHRRRRLSGHPWRIFGPPVAFWALNIAAVTTLPRDAAVAIVAASGAASIGVGLANWRRWERRRWARPVRALARSLDAFNGDPERAEGLPHSPALSALVRPVRDLQRRVLELQSQLSRDGDRSLDVDESAELAALSIQPDIRMTRSGTFEPPTGMGEASMAATAEFSTLDMINRLEPRSLRWMESSHSEQLFLGWSLAELREKSFLEVVQPDDRDLARQQLRIAIAKGEGHGMVYRITTARGETRAVELNVGVRYGPDRRILHLRCHLADVTAKLLDETELRRRTVELIQANDQLRKINRELERLKDRYGDLYQNAPAMYFAVDRRGRFLECNETLVRTLGIPREALVGRPAADLVPLGRKPSELDPFAELSPSEPIEFETEWARADGDPIAIWVTGSPVASGDGRVRQFRCAAQDLTAKRTLEAELKLKNDHLARANVELSRKNKELDEFTYVVSHDLQEPLRTLIAFSDFLMSDQADRLDEEGKEHVRYIVEASRRLRSLIQDLLTLSRAGKVTAEFTPIDLAEVVAIIEADHAELLRSRGGEIRVVGPLPTIWGDRDRIGQLLANLVGNALKYNQDPRPTVSIGVEADEPGPMVTLSVGDNGIGIEPQFHSKIFLLFRRLHTREEYEGTGAGLAICQKIAQAHGGRIWVNSRPGEGSTFFVTLPRTGPAPHSAERPGAGHAP